MNFPDNPTVGQLWPYGGRVFRWTGVAWKQDLSAMLLSGKLVLADPDNNSSFTITDQLLISRWTALGV